MEITHASNNLKYYFLALQLTISNNVNHYCGCEIIL